MGIAVKYKKRKINIKMKRKYENVKSILFFGLWSVKDYEMKI